MYTQIPYHLVSPEQLAAEKLYAPVDIETLNQFFVTEIKIGLEKHQSLSRFSGANIRFASNHMGRPGSWFLAGRQAAGSSQGMVSWSFAKNKLLKMCHLGVYS